MFDVMTVGDRKKSPFYREYVCDTEEDVENLPTNQTPTNNAKIDEKNYCAVGSCALVLETGEVWVLSTQGVWTKL